MARGWDHHERLFDERFFLDEETLASAQAYLIRQASEPEEGEEIRWWYEVGFKLNESDGNGHFCCYDMDDDKEAAFKDVRHQAGMVRDVLDRLITAIDAEMEGEPKADSGRFPSPEMEDPRFGLRGPEEVLDGGAEPPRERDSE